LLEGLHAFHPFLLQPVSHDTLVKEKEGEKSQKIDGLDVLMHQESMEVHRLSWMVGLG
jgi:hypothetical protein